MSQEHHPAKCSRELQLKRLPINFLFAGEQFDSNLGLYDNRARHLNVSTGRFWTMDTFEVDAFSRNNFTAPEPWIVKLGSDLSSNIQAFLLNSRFR